MVLSYVFIYAATSSWFFTFGELLLSRSTKIDYLLTLILAILLYGTREGIDPGVHGPASIFVAGDHRALMFTILAMIDASSKIIGGPLMAAFYSLNIDSRGRSGELCFLASAISLFPPCTLQLSLNNSIGLVWRRVSGIVWN
jgi:hypothetical protein